MAWWMTRIGGALAVALAAAGGPASAAEGELAAPGAVSADPIAGRLEPLIRDVIAKGGIPGVAVAVVRGGKIAWTGAFGVADAGSARAVTGDTVFEAAALGEPVFAYAVMRLAERGEFDLDRPLTLILPTPELRNDERTRAITARRVLSHSAGLADSRRGGPLEVVAEPGDAFAHSRDGYAYLQRVIEAVTTLPADEFVRREVFAPLGMAASSYAWRDAWAASAAVGHDYLQLPLPAEKPPRPDVARTLRTTAADYARFLAETVRPTLVKPATAGQMFRSEIKVEKGISWGLGWGLEQGEGGPWFWHWGETTGARSFALGSRESGDAVVVLTNGENGLSAAEPIVGEAIGGTHPVFSWLDFDRYDSPARTIRERVVRAGVANGERGVLRTLDELEHTYPRAAFTEKLVNRIGYELLGKKKVAAAIAVFDHNVKLYPDAWNVYDSLGEAYAADGDVRLAIQAYRKSLKLNPDNANAKAALRELRDAPQR